MKIPPKKPHFFKPIQKDFKHGLKIPIGFLKYLKGHDQIKHVVLRKGGKNWLVKLNGRRFEAGWAAFVEEHDLRLGDLLIFRHEGDMEFEVSIFDSTHCDREYAEYLQEEGYNNVEDTTKNFEFTGKSNLCIVSSSKVFPRADAGTHNPCGQSNFECTVKPYCITNGYLRLPKQFAMENGLINKKCGLIIRDERQRSWNLRLATINSTVHILGGWRMFRVSNDLMEGDYMMYEVVANGENPIWKFHGKEKKGQSAGGPSFALSNSVCGPSGPARNEANSWKFEFKGKGSLESARNADKPNPNIKAFPKEESATHSCFGQSHLVCIVKPYCLSRNCFYLPKRFAQANGLINKKGDLVIRDERHGSWNLRLDINNAGVYIGEGWHEFCVDNDLKEGDCIKFEVVTNGERPIWKFHGAVTDKPFGQSDFVCIVRPYCFVNDFLHIPTKFAFANGLTNKRRDLIIRDERVRSWNFKLHPSGNSVCIRGGWHEFRDANCLKEGDCIMFEVVSNGNTPIWKYNGKCSGNLRMPNITEAIDKII